VLRQSFGKALREGQVPVRHPDVRRRPHRDTGRRHSRGVAKPVVADRVVLGYLHQRRRASPADALRLAAVAVGTADTDVRVDLDGMWALPADPAAPRSHEPIRALDGKGRLMLPITVAAAASVRAAAGLTHRRELSL
jgi:hypothetical protein